MSKIDIIDKDEKQMKKSLIMDEESDYFAAEWFKRINDTSSKYFYDKKINFKWYIIYFVYFFSLNLK